MTLRPIRNDEDYETTLAEIEALWDAARRVRLKQTVSIFGTAGRGVYEAEHYPISDPHPIELILHVMDAHRLARSAIWSRIWAHVRVYLKF
ncbi:MAG: hypothetical protein R2911_07070 [Caldilineaceae bacterium]